jgi:3-oxoacyl-[acyl-carrier-protein] synthase-3
MRIPISLIFMSANIKAISYYLPERIYSNEEYFQEFPETKTANLEKVGVEKRHLAGKNELASDMAFAAAEKLFSEHKIDRNEIDFLIVSILEHDFYAPTSGCFLHGKLGLKKKCGAIDFDLGCSAYVYGLGLADGIMRSMGAKTVLLLTVSVLTKKFHQKDRSSRFVFGDAASATLLTYSEKENMGPFVFGTDGVGYEKIMVRDGAARFPITENSSQEIKDEFGNITAMENLVMDGMGVFLFSIRTVPPMIEELLAKAGLTQNEIDLFIFHQPNVFLNETLRKKMGIPETKFVHCMKDFGNTVQNTIPIAIYESQKSGKLKPGMTVVLAGFGSGLSWAATIVRF